MSNSFNGYNLGQDPFVGISDETILWGGKLCAIKRIIVSGKIYDCGKGPNTERDILKSISDWQSVALNGYGPITVGGFSAEYARCESIEITNSDYLGAEYRVEFLAYPDDWFSNIVGILEPVDNVNISQENNGLIIIKRTASARAANDQGFDKVYTWLNDLDLKSPPDLNKYQINVQLANDLAPKNIVETIDRINGSISVEVTFIQNEGAQNSTVLNYSTDIRYDDKSGIYSVTISGSIEGHTETDISEMRDLIGEIGLFQIAEDVFLQIVKDATLDSKPASLSFSENDETDTINFSAVYNTFPEDGQKKYFNFTVDYDHIKDITTVTISGTISFDGKISMKDRDGIIKSIIDEYDFASLCEEEFNQYSPNPKNPLNKNNPVSYSITINKGADITADVSVAYNNEDIFKDIQDLLSLDYDISIDFSPNITYPIQFINGTGGIFNYSAKKRGSATIRGTAVSKNPGIGNSILDSIETILDNEISSFGIQDEIYLEKNVIFTDVSDNGYSYEFEIKKGGLINYN